MRRHPANLSRESVVDFAHRRKRPAQQRHVYTSYRSPRRRVLGLESLEPRTLLTVIPPLEFKGSFPTGSTPNDIVLSDLDRNGALDAVVPNYYEGSVSVLLGNGDGSFQAEQRFPVGSPGGNGIAVADLNHDTYPDVVLANDVNVVVFLGMGDGALAPPQVVHLGVHGAADVAIGDVNGDRHPDIVSCGVADSHAFILLGDGSGNFSVSSTFEVGNDLSSLVLGDFNGDRMLDVVIPACGSSQIVVGLNDGSGHFRADYRMSTANSPRSVAVNDFDDDGDLDLAVTDTSGRGLSVYLGIGDGTFDAESLYPMTRAVKVTTGDLNGDGAPDIVVPNYWSLGVSILIGNGDGTFQTPSVVGAEFDTIWDACIRDINNDGLQDLVAAKHDPNSSVLSFVSSTGPLFEILARGVAYDNNWHRGDPVKFDGSNLGYVVDEVFPRGARFYALGLVSKTFGPALVIRGTKGVIDLWDDTHPYGVGYLQFLDNWEAVREWLYDDRDVTGIPVDIVGHSLGGALAQWIAAAVTPDTAGQAKIDELVTFNSPGISKAFADRFNPKMARKVTHYIVNGDVVEMAGEAYVAGKVEMASYSDPITSPLDFDKHLRPVLAPKVLNPSTGDYRYRASKVSWQSFDSVAELSSPRYSHTDPEYIHWLLGSEIDLNCGASHTPALLHFVGIPAMLAHRGTTEFLRQAIGWFAHALPASVIEWNRGADGNLVLQLTSGSDLFALTHVTVTPEFNLTVDDGDPPMLRFDGGLSINLGDAINIDLPAWLGGSFAADHLIELAELDMGGTIDRGQLQVHGDLKLLGNIAKLAGSAQLDLQRSKLTVGGTIDVLDGFVTATVTASVGTNLDVVMAGAAEVRIPNDAPWIGGLPLADGQLLLNYVSDLNPSNDFVAGWGSLGPVELGLRIWFDGRPPEILGAKEIDELEPSDGDGEAGPPYGESYRIPPGTDWGLFFVEWENPSTALSLHVRTPSGQVLSEADIANAPSMNLVAELSSDTRKAIRVNTPESGVWHVAIDDASGLGAVDMSAMVSEPPPTVSVVSVSGGLFRQPINVQIAASASGSDVTTALFYDTDREGLDGIMIADGLIPTSGIVSYIWDTTNVSAGDYFVYARALDEHNPPVYAYANAPIRIADQASGAVAVNQASGQADPTRSSSINFAVVFNQPVSDFADGDITISGTAGATTAIITNPSGDRVTYIVVVTGMVRSGTVIATIAPGVAHDEMGSANVASTSTDDEVSYICPWQNYPTQLDTSDDTYVSPIDALLVINRLNGQGSGRLPSPSPNHAPPPFYDVNGDYYMSPIDALLVINYLNAGGGEGERGDIAATVSVATTGRTMTEIVETHGLNRAEVTAKERAGGSPADDCRAPTGTTMSLDQLFAMLSDTDHARIWDSVYADRDVFTADLEEFLECVLEDCEESGQDSFRRVDVARARLLVQRVISNSRV